MYTTCRGVRARVGLGELPVPSGGIGVASNLGLKANETQNPPRGPDPGNELTPVLVSGKPRLCGLEDLLWTVVLPPIASISGARLRHPQSCIGVVWKAPCSRKAGKRLRSIMFLFAALSERRLDSAEPGNYRLHVTTMKDLPSNRYNDRPTSPARAITQTHKWEVTH